jgi:hypothetical protein
MEWLFALLAVIAVAVFLTAPLVMAVGLVIVLIWTAFLLYLIFYRADPVSRAVTELQSAIASGEQREK